METQIAILATIVTIFRLFRFSRVRQFFKSSFPVVESSTQYGIRHPIDFNVKQNVLSTFTLYNSEKNYQTTSHFYFKSKPLIQLADDIIVLGQEETLILKNTHE